MLNVKVFLTNPPLNMAETPLQYHRPLVPLGLGHLGGMIEDASTDGAWSRYVAERAAGTRVEPYRRSSVVAAQDNMLLSFYGQYSYEQLRRRIAAHSGLPSDELFIGMSILSDGMRNARDMLKKLRRDFPRAKLIVGGPHATFFPHDFYADPNVRHGPLADYVVRNEGELAILGIINGDLSTLQSTEQNGEKYDIDPATCTQDDGYLIIDGGQFGRLERGFGPHVLDALPPPAYFLFEDEEGRLPYEPDRRYGLEAPAANINSSRGCPHHCTFCTIPMLAPGYRTLSPSRVVELIKFLSSVYGISSIFFREDNFMYEGGSVDGSRWRDVEEVCSELSSALPGLRWAIEARADNLLQPSSYGQSRLDLLAAAGLSGIYMGVESGSELMLQRYVKEVKLPAISEAIQGCADRGIGVVTTACYGDQEVFCRRDYPNLVEPVSSETFRMREEILRATRAFLDQNRIPADRREEYALTGIPVSALYKLLDRERHTYPALVENYDPVSRYIYPRGYRWWSNKIYNLKRRVRPYTSYEFQPTP